MQLLPIISILLLSVFPDSESAQKRTYDRYKVYNLALDTKDKAEFVKRYDGMEGYNFWIFPSVLPSHGYAHLMVAPHVQEVFEQEMEQRKIKIHVINKDVEKAIEEENQSQIEARISARSLHHGSTYNFDYFPRYHEMVDFMKRLVNKRKHSRLIKIGKSSEGRYIYGVEVGNSQQKPVFFIDAGIHAREWASHVVALYIIKNVVENEDDFASKMNLVIIPCVNPDGYEFTHKIDRLWRKSRGLIAGSNCRGVDLNRNFDSHWGEYRSDKRPCTESYAGPRAFSEPESKALRDVLLRYKPVAYLTLHSYGPLILYPWGFTKNLPSNWKLLDSIAQKAAFKINAVNGTEYQIGTSARVLYESSGASDDWAMEHAGVPIVYTMELPEYNKENFIVPKKKIKPLVKETYEGFLSMVNSIHLICKNI